MQKQNCAHIFFKKSPSRTTWTCVENWRQQTMSLMKMSVISYLNTWSQVYANQINTLFEHMSLCLLFRWRKISWKWMITISPLFWVSIIFDVSANAIWILQYIIRSTIQKIQRAHFLTSIRPRQHWIRVRILIGTPHFNDFFSLQNVERC